MTAFNYNYTGYNFSVSGQASSPLAITNNGSHIFVVDDGTNNVFSYWLHNGSYTGFFFPTTGLSNPSGADYNGSDFLICGYSADRCYNYLGNGSASGWSFTTNEVGEIYVSTIAYNNTGYACSGTSTEDIQQYSLKGVYTHTNIDMTGHDGNIVGIEWNGSSWFGIGQDKKSILEYNPDGTYLSNISVGSWCITPTGLDYNGSSFFCIDDNTDAVYEFAKPSTIDSLPPVITVTSINMTYNETYNENVWLNFTTDESAVCFVNSEYWNNTGLTKNSWSLYESTAPSQFYDLIIQCNDTVGNNATLDLYFTKDTINPVIASSVPNKDNSSTLYPDAGYLILDSTFTDNNDLYSYFINITKRNLPTVYYETDDLISGTSYNFYQEINVENFTSGSYIETITICDSHTKKDITISNNIITDKYLGYRFGNIIINIVPEEKPDNIKTVKLKDRYNFKFNYSKKYNDKSYILSSSHNIKYISHSKYKGHFVIDDKYWLDFQNDGDVIVQDLHNDSYLIKVFNANNVIEFNSIGELNCITEIIEFDYEEEEETNLIADQFSLFNTIIIFAIFLFMQLFFFFLAFKSGSRELSIGSCLMGIFIGLSFLMNISLNSNFKISIIIYIFINVFLGIQIFNNRED